ISRISSSSGGVTSSTKSAASLADMRFSARASTLKLRVSGGFRTLTTSPGCTSREAFTGKSPISTRPFLQASVAILLVLKTRTAQSHLSTRTLSAMLFLFVEKIHGAFNTNGAKTLNNFNAGIHFFGQLLLLLPGPVAQHIIYLKARIKMIANTKTQPGVIVSTQHFGDISQTVVPAMASLCFYTQRSKRQCQVVDQYQQVFQRNIFFLQPVIHCPSAQINVGSWFEQKKSPPFEFVFGHKAVTLIVKSNIGRPCQSVQYL